MCASGGATAHRHCRARRQVFSREVAAYDAVTVTVTTFAVIERDPNLRPVKVSRKSAVVHGNIHNVTARVDG